MSGPTPQPTSPSRVRTCARVLKGEGLSNNNTGEPFRTRVRVREGFYGPAIARDTDTAVDYALQATRNDPRYRSAWCFYCLHLGVNTFLDQLDAVLSCHAQGEILDPARAFHARLRQMADRTLGRIRTDGKGGAR